MTMALINRLLVLAPLCVLAACNSAPPADPAAVARGRAIFASCSTCHALNGQTIVGPSLRGVVGRKAGSVAGFAYSDALKTSNFDWTPDKLATFLANPDSVPGTNMAITPLAPDQAKDVVTFLSTNN
jgi:cytochrome c